MNQIKFKMLASGYPSFDFPEDLVEEVDLSEFYETEENRFPLYIGTQFGIFPRDFPVETFEGKKIAVLSKSLLSGLQSGISICEIKERKRIELENFSLEGQVWKREKMKKYSVEHVQEPTIKIQEFYLHEIWFYFELIGNKYRGFSLPEAYHQAIFAAYNAFVIFGYENRESGWRSFLRSEQAEDYMNLFRLLDQCTKAVYAEKNRLPLPLEREIQLFKNIRNPYQKRSKKYSELPAEEDILVLSDLGLCIYYNNLININTQEAEEVQDTIFVELKYRNCFFKEEYLLRKHANPITIETIQGVPVLKVREEVDYREKKDIPDLKKGTANGQLMYERYYGMYSRLTDVQLVDVLNEQVGIGYWGMGRATIIRAIRAQLKSRCIDVSSISNDQSFSLKYCVVLKNKKLIRLGDLTQVRLKLILRGYLQRCYPFYAVEKTRIISYDLEKLEIRYSADGISYNIPINDLLKKKGEMKNIRSQRDQ